MRLARGLRWRQPLQRRGVVRRRVGYGDPDTETSEVARMTTVARASLVHSHLVTGSGQFDLDLGANEPRLGHGEVQLLPGRLVDDAADFEVTGVEDL